MQDGRNAPAVVVSVQADVEGAHLGAGALDRLDPCAEILGEVLAAGHDTDDDKVVCPAVGLENLVRYARHRTRHSIGVHDDRLGLELFCHLTLLS